MEIDDALMIQALLLDGSIEWVPFKCRVIVSTKHEMTFMRVILREAQGKYILLEDTLFNHHLERPLAVIIHIKAKNAVSIRILFN